MITIRHDHKNKRAFVSVDEATFRNKRGLHSALYEIGQENVKHTRLLIQSTDKNGRFYRFRGRQHRASAPGEAPANRTGQLLNSVDYIVRGSEQMEFGDRVFYGKFLEDGTRFMKARPHLKTTVKAKSKDAKNSIRKHVREEVEK